MFNETITRLAEEILQAGESSLTPSQAASLIPETSNQALDLIHAADRIRRCFKHNNAFSCAIINAKSGLCREDCAFCAQSAHHQSAITTYGLRDTQALIDTGLQMAAAGATHYSMVTSGTCLNDAEIDTVCQVARTLKNKTHLTLCASLGMLSEDAACRLKQAGISRYHHNLETAGSFFDQICTTHTYDDDIQTVRMAQRTGLTVCSGGIFGLGESWSQRLELAFTLKKLAVDSVPVNFLNPIAGTRLADRPLLNPLEALACIALVRFILPRADIPVCGGREVTLKDFQSWIFLAGANGLMVGNYLTTQGRQLEMDMDMMYEMGLTYAKK